MYYPKYHLKYHLKYYCDIMSYDYLNKEPLDIVLDEIREIIRTHNKELIKDFYSKTSWFFREKFCDVMKEEFITHLTNNNADIYGIVCSVDGDSEIKKICALILKELYEKDKLNLLIEAIPYSPRSMLVEIVNDNIELRDIICFTGFQPESIQLFIKNIVTLLIPNPSYVPYLTILKNLLSRVNIENLLEIIDLFVKYNYPLDNKIYYLLHNYRSKNAISAIEKLLSYNIMPPPKYILKLLMQDNTDILNLFCNHNIDVKSSLSNFVSQKKKTQSKIEVLNRIGMTLDEYIKISDWYNNYYSSNGWTS